MLDLNRDLKEQSLELKEKKSALEEALLEIKKLKTQISELQEQITQKDQVIELLKKENASVRDSLKKNEQEIVKLSNENTLLVTRLLDQKQKEVEAMNQVNDLYKSVEKQKEELTKTQEKYKTIPIEGKGNVLQISNSGGTGSRDSKKKEEEILILQPPTKKSRKIEIGTEINTITVNEAGTLCGVGCEDKTIKLYDASYFNLKTTLYGPTESISHVSFSPNGKLILGTSFDNTARIWETDNNRSKHTLTGHSKKIQTGDFTTDSSKVVTGSHDRTLKVWEVQGGNCLKTILCQSTCNDLSISKGTDLVCSAHFDNALKFWDIRAGKQVDVIKEAHQQQITSVFFSNDGNYVLSNGRDNCLKLFDIRKFVNLSTFTHNDYKNMLNFNKACMSPCGQYACGGSYNGNIFIWNIKLNKLETQLKEGHTGPITSVYWTSEGASILSSSQDKSFCVWQ